MSTLLVAGGAGFIGSHLSDRLLADGHRVIAVDNFVTGSPANVAHLGEHPDFSLIEHDVTEPLRIEKPLDGVFHLASPASPKDFETLPEEIMWTNVLGTRNLSDLARAHDARLLFASTSEVYGDPGQHPQPETYFGNVNSLGPRAPYDEGKRFGETLVMSRRRTHGIDARIVRLFNTYGPRMRPGDGRMSVHFIQQALNGEPLTVWGDGRNTRSLCYVTDLVAGLDRAMFGAGTDGEVFNLGAAEEHSVQYFAQTIVELAQSDSEITYLESRPDDPARRRPDVSKAMRVLGWEPVVSLRDGLLRTIAWHREQRAVVESR